MRQWRMVIPLVGILVLLFFFRLAFTDHILARGDTYAYFYPYWAVRDAHLRAGEIPLWTPNLFMGAPLLANSQLGTFYPPNWLTIYATPPDAIRLSILLHVFWTMLGAMLLAQYALGISTFPALVAGVAFGLGGYIGSHVEQINQLHGLSWMPWLFWVVHLAMHNGRYWLLLGVMWAFQLLSGHTQTVFITGVGLGVYVMLHAVFVPMPRQRLKASDDMTAKPAQGADPLTALRADEHAASAGGVLRAVVGRLMGLVIAVIIAIILALPQLIPTQGLISQSNRGGGLNPQQVTAFSLDPFIIGRGLLPSYDGQPFGEYVAYMGIIGLALAVIGMLASDRRKWIWLILGVVGFAFALGRFNPVYYTLLAELPGFNLFRVPARWLALYALAGAMLIGLGVHTVMHQSLNRRRRVVALGIFVMICATLIISAQFADRASEPVVGAALPTITTWIAWAVAIFVGMMMMFVTPSIIKKGGGAVIIIMFISELFVAGQFLPHQDLTDPSAYHDAGFAINQLRAYQTTNPPARFLSISAQNFNLPASEENRLRARWEGMGISAQGQAYAFSAMKLKQVAAANLPLIWNIPTIDGFDGGVLPTAHYTAFTSLMLPQGALRTVDGRLRENLALPSCEGACIPDERWLDLTNTRYLLTDKVYDVVYDGIFFDTQFKRSTGVSWIAPYPFIADEIQVLYRCDAMCQPLQITVNDADTRYSSAETHTLSEYELAIFVLDDATSITSITPHHQNITISAVTVMDRRTGDFLQIHPHGWQRVYSADIKIYENIDVMPRAFMVYEALLFPDTWDGTESALSAMRDARFDPRITITINHDGDIPVLDGVGDGQVNITTYHPTEIVMTIQTDKAGFVVLTDAYYPNWSALVDGVDVPIYRADVMFRAVWVDAGTHQVTMRYRGW